MIGLPSGTRVWLATGATDMRKGFDGLSALVQTVLRHDPFSGHVFAFRGRRGDLVKLLWWDGDGLCLYAKRLERGVFASPWRDESAARLSLTVTELQLFLEGSALVGKVALSPPAFTLGGPPARPSPAA
jgi:transposase